MPLPLPYRYKNEARRTLLSKRKSDFRIAGSIQRRFCKQKDEMIKYSLLHPSRQRCSMAFQAFSEWMSKASDQNKYEYILSIDTDDPQIECYKNQFKNTGIKLIINNNRSIVDAVNMAAKHSTGDILISISDDFGCPEKWDLLLYLAYDRENKYELERIAKDYDDISSKEEMQEDERLKYFAVMIDDCINGNQSGCMTLPILSRSAYEQLGHIYNPVYFSMFADNELHDVCKNNGWLIYSDLKFEHRHFINGKNPKDATYERENSTQAYNMGKKIYEHRKANNFQV